MKSERTTVVLDGPLMTELKRSARARGLSLSGLISILVREGLRALEVSPGGYRFSPLIVQGTSPPMVDISNRDQLYDYMDDE